jgi:peptidoglycan/LPS O-acetylase OafA/YrhL
MTTEFRINNFDLLRIVAATQVLLGHSATHLGLALPAGWQFVLAFPGVPIFFTISGFLISASYERSSSLANYASNRVLRIAPGLWCVVFATATVAALFGFDFLHFRALVWLLCQMVGVIFTPGFLKSFGFGHYNGSLWSIPVEIQFYFLLPFLYWGGKRIEQRRNALLFIAWVIFLTASVFVAKVWPPQPENVLEPLTHKLLGFSFVPHFYMFLSGVLLQRWQAYRSPWIAGKGLLWLMAYLLGHFTLMSAGSLHTVVVMPLLAVTTISMAYTAPQLSQWLLRGNDISYGVYI